MSLREDFFACAGELRREQHTLPGGKIIYVGEVGGDEWLEIEAETMRYRAKTGRNHDPFIDARLIVRSVCDEANLPIFKRPILTGDLVDDKAALAAYEEELQKINKMPHRIFTPLLRLVNQVNFADEGSYEALKKKSASETSAGSSSLPEIPATSTSEPSSEASAA